MHHVKGTALRSKLFALAVASAFSMAAPPVIAQDAGADTDVSTGVDDGGLFRDIGFSFSGFVRFDSAFHTDSDENPNNQRTNPFNRKNTGRSAFPSAGLGSVANLQESLFPGVAGADIGRLLGSGLDTTIGNLLAAAPGIPSIAPRSTNPGHNDWNLNQLRGKFDVTLTLGSNVSIYSSLRTVYDFGTYDEFERGDSRDTFGNPSAPAGFNQRKSRYFEYADYQDGGGSCVNYLERCGDNYMADFTALYLDVTAGPLLIRMGQQQIAWGQALFFRVFDVPNGLDLRRHLILDDALEEYADERISAPGVRVTWQATDQWEADAYAQMFTPSIYPNANTPYNVIPSQFTVHETWTEKHRGEDFNYGLRLRGNFGNWGLQFIATQRYRHEGTFRWIESGAVKDLPGLPGTGAIMAGTPLEADPTGVWSANEWFTFAGSARLDGVEGLNTLVREFQPFTGLLAGSEIGGSKEAAARELDLFFSIGGGLAAGNLNGGGLRGHLIHEYHKEEVYGAGISYVVEAEPGSLFDQLIINVESHYTPERTFTEKSLSRDFIESDESVTALVMEKYHRWFQEFPATYMVFQALHQSDSDLFGQHLGCQGGTGGDPGTVAGEFNRKTKQCGDNKKGGSNNVVIALMQPFPNYIYRLTGAALLDVEGGLFLQGGFRWSPGNDLTFDFIYNYVDGNLYGDENTNALQAIDFADDFTIRAAYQF
ncbi:hypothetical protein DFR24_3988 [Panacagrimonas perspica]|uniref:DUF1302 family protein n=1 Tax=Panacagrimonas perspica TaxID=381431 RepID=A0A4R7NYD9_9GAMM|nr:DUF1302 family protein [Panacagrimonas perspica]TDU25550.1 hypothetical protein DFR24_3988 [Panacagrimonas perspica]THD03845.1 hypothetical protein B1810_08235 [Panacagrimonas perspica]